MVQPRDLSSSHFVHVLNRGVDRQDIVWRDTDREHFLDSVGYRSRRHGVVVLAYALMSNHYHLVLDTSDGDLAQMMREFQSGYARAVNKRVSRTGPLFERRYTSIPIVDDSQIIVTVRYVHRNPVDIVGAEGLAAYEWSSLGPAVGLRPAPDWYRPDTLARRVELTDHVNYVLAPHPSDRRPCAWKPPQRRTTLAEVVDAVDSSDMDVTQRNTAIALLSAELRAADPASVGALLRCSPKRVRNLRAQAKALVVDCASFALAIDAALAELG